MAAFRWMPTWLRTILTTPIGELSRWQCRLRYFLEIMRFGYRRLIENRAGQMAAALAYRTIFGIIPVLIIVILIFRAFGGAEVFTDFLERLLEAANLEAVRSPDESLTLAQWVRGFVGDVDTQISGKAVGIIGTLVLAWAAIGLLTTIEHVFNQICQAPEHRPLSRRIPLYWTILTIGPGLLYLSFHFKTRFVRFVVESGFAGPFGKPIAIFTSFISVWLLLFSLYLFVPHTRIRVTSTAIGAAFAAVLWSIATHLFGAYIGWSFSRENAAFTILYGTLGLVPLFMLWIYFLWVVVLFGLELAFVLQAVGKRLRAGLPVRAEAPGMFDPATIVLLMKAAADAFKAGHSMTPEAFTEETGISGDLVDRLVSALCNAGYLHRVDDAQDGAVTLARPADSIMTGDLIGIAQGLTPLLRKSDGGTADWMERFREAQRSLELHRPLAELDGASA